MAQIPEIPRKAEKPAEFNFLRQAWAQGRLPDPQLTVSEWADANRILSSRGSNEAGPWRTSRTPYLQAIMDALSPSHSARRVVLMKGSQIGAPLDVNTPILTPTGFIPLGKLSPGDQVFDETGKLCTVLGLSPVFTDRDCFRLTFSDGAELVADAEHLWTVEDKLKPTKRTIRTLEIFRTFRVGCQNRYTIPCRLPGSSIVREVVWVERVPSIPVQCIAVDSPSHLFLAGREMIATHNTEAGVNWIGFVIHHAPGPMMIVWPNLEMARRNSKQRIETMINECPALTERVAAQRSNSGANTILVKEFNGGILVIVGSNSASGLRSMPVRYLFLDEVDVYPPFVGKGMDPVEEVIKRTSTFEHRSKVFMSSTPTLKHISRIEEQFETTNKQYFYVPCPRCGHKQQLVWENVRWEKGKFDTVHYVCESCGGKFYEHEKPVFLAQGEWRATSESVDAFTVGFHISSLYSPYGWLSWQTCAKEWEAAAGSPEKQRSFRTEVLGLTWEETQNTPNWRRLYDRREDWQIGTVPEGVLVLSGGADIQRDRIEVSVWGWAPDFECWLVDHIVLQGNPSVTGPGSVWDDLTALLGRVWVNEDGEVFQLHNLGVDTGDGNVTLEAFAWARSVRPLPVMCLKGYDRWDREAPVSGPKRIDVGRNGKKMLRGVESWTVSVSIFKAQLYARLAMERPTEEELAAGGRFPPGYVHLPKGCSADLVQQLVSEECVSVKMKTGRIRKEWRKTQERNEFLDCFIYSRAAMHEADVYGEVFWDRVRGTKSAAKETPKVPVETAPAPKSWVPRVSSRWV